MDRTPPTGTPSYARTEAASCRKQGVGTGGYEPLSRPGKKTYFDRRRFPVASAFGEDWQILQKQP